MNEANGLNEVMFTSAAVLDLLLQIDELRDYTIGISETFDGKLQLQVGDSIYMIETDTAPTIRVEDEVVGEIETQTEEAYNDIINDSIDITDVTDYTGDDFIYEEPESDDVVEAGIIKELAKSLALGGLIRFATKRLLK